MATFVIEYPYVVWLYVAPAMLMVAALIREEYRNGSVNPTDVALVFIPVFNLIMVIVGLCIILYTIYDDPKYVFGDKEKQ